MIGFTSLEDRRIRRDMIEVYKLLTGKEKIDYRQFFNFTNASYSLKGHEKKLAKDRSRLDTRKFFFSQRVVNGWNGLPAEVINSTSVNSFKNAYVATTAKIWTTEADQLPVHQPTSTSTSTRKSYVRDTVVLQRCRRRFVVGCCLECQRLVASRRYVLSLFGWLWTVVARWRMLVDCRCSMYTSQRLTASTDNRLLGAYSEIIAVLAVTKRFASIYVQVQLPFWTSRLGAVGAHIACLSESVGWSLDPSDPPRITARTDNATVALMNRLKFVVRFGFT